MKHHGMLSISVTQAKSTWTSELAAPENLKDADVE